MAVYRHRAKKKQNNSLCLVFFCEELKRSKSLLVFIISMIKKWLTSSDSTALSFLVFV